MSAAPLELPTGRQAAHGSPIPVMEVLVPAWDKSLRSASGLSPCSDHQEMGRDCAISPRKLLILPLFPRNLIVRLFLAGVSLPQSSSRMRSRAPARGAPAFVGCRLNVYQRNKRQLVLAAGLATAASTKQMSRLFTSPPAGRLVEVSLCSRHHPQPCDNELLCCVAWVVLAHAGGHRSMGSTLSDLHGLFEGVWNCLSLQCSICQPGSSAAEGKASGGMCADVVEQARCAECVSLSTAGSSAAPASVPVELTRPFREQ